MDEIATINYEIALKESNLKNIECMNLSKKGKVISLLEGGYDTSDTLGLARCVNAHVKALRNNNI